MRGSLRLTVAGEGHTLQEGDSIYFDASQAHSYARGGTRVCEALVITTA